MKWMGGTTRWAHLGMLKTVYSSVSDTGLLKKKANQLCLKERLFCNVHCWSLFADLLSESLSTSKTIPRPQDTLFWCGAFYFLHPHWSQQTGSTHRRLLLQSKTCFWCFLSKVNLPFFFLTHVILGLTDVGSILMVTCGVFSWRQTLIFMLSLHKVCVLLS